MSSEYSVNGRLEADCPWSNHHIGWDALTEFVGRGPVMFHCDRRCSGREANQQSTDYGRNVAACLPRELWSTAAAPAAGGNAFAAKQCDNLLVLRGAHWKSPID
jgi:hypothetical protein